MTGDEERVPPDEEEGVWCITDGDPRWGYRQDTFRADGVENLTYSTPYALEIERVSF